MTARYPRHIALTGPLASYVDHKVASGEYASASEVIRTALRLLMQRESARPVANPGKSSFATY
ncbi:type II toxin-antitoxin system ParD family antitoxin [Paraburkholderia strydomiana]|uniref:type II toxin-antitoxin system ParD family antitoxin n=1 Tax=Paraburkholderia strydomiana TaxID=1245417 RepID=UPI001BEA9AC5|nr:type II toxin-antitoxin system ParD family antitoxin [Paraburkholderia strydomiana]